MDLAEYRQLIERIPYGKRLPSAVYVFREKTSTFGEKLDALLRRIAEGHGATIRTQPSNGLNPACSK
jgi:hypothetical protein